MYQAVPPADQQDAVTLVDTASLALAIHRGQVEGWVERDYLSLHRSCGCITWYILGP